MTESVLPFRRRPEHTVAWIGDVTWREVAALRDHLLDRLERAGISGLALDVREVTEIDAPGVALLIGANFRAACSGRQLVLIDDDGGAVSTALSRRRVLPNFEVTAHAGEVGAIEPALPNPTRAGRGLIHLVAQPLIATT